MMISQDSCLLGDSVYSNVNFGLLERESQKSITAVKADGLDNDKVSSTVNFLEVIDSELNRKEFSTLVLAAGPAEISKLNTKEDCDPKQLSVLTVDMAKKIFCMAEAALVEHPELEKVVLIRNTPRFDPPSSDPTGLKPQLILLADSVYFGMWCDSKLKEKIHLGNHDVNEWSRHEISHAYGFPHISGYDGAHMFGVGGRTILTRSILSILKKAIITPNSALSSTANPSSSSYDPLLILRDRIQSHRGAQSTPQQQRSPQPSVPPTSSNVPPPSSAPVLNSRTSVI